MEVLRPWLLVLLLPAATLGPGLLLVRRLRWSPAERLVTAVFLSLTCTSLVPENRR